MGYAQASAHEASGQAAAEAAAEAAARAREETLQQACHVVSCQQRVTTLCCHMRSASLTN